jgi:hypothetical protein
LTFLCFVLGLVEAIADRFLGWDESFVKRLVLFLLLVVILGLGSGLTCRDDGLGCLGWQSGA